MKTLIATAIFSVIFISCNKDRGECVLEILELAEKQLGYSNLELEVEYQQNTVGRYKLAFDGAVFQLINTQTACLAPDQCGIPQEKPRVRLSASGVNCSPNSGCC